MNISSFNKPKNQDTILKEKPHRHGQRLMDNQVEAQNSKMSNNSVDSLICNSSNRGRVAIFIDGSNLFHTALQLGIEIDYAKLLCHLTQDARLLRAFFYSGIDRINEKQQGFLFWMRRNGYRVVTKEMIQLPDGSKKSNLDVEIAVDMITLSPYYDTAVLVGGHGDLAYAVNALSYKGVRVEIVSLRSMSSDLIDVADCFIDIESIKEHIQKDSHSSYNYKPLSNSF